MPFGPSRARRPTARRGRRCAAGSRSRTGADMRRDPRYRTIRDPSNRIRLPTGFESGSAGGRAASRRIVNQWLRRSEQPPQLEARDLDRALVADHVDGRDAAGLPRCSRPSGPASSPSSDLARACAPCRGRSAARSRCARARCRRRGRRRGAGTGPARPPPKPSSLAGGAPAGGGVEERLGDLDAVADGQRARGADGGDGGARLAGHAAVDLRARVGDRRRRRSVGAAAAQRVGARDDGLGLERLGRPSVAGISAATTPYR